MSILVNMSCPSIYSRRILYFACVRKYPLIKIQGSFSWMWRDFIKGVSSSEWRYFPFFRFTNIPPLSLLPLMLAKTLFYSTCFVGKATLCAFLRFCYFNQIGNLHETLFSVQYFCCSSTATADRISKIFKGIWKLENIIIGLSVSYLTITKSKVCTSSG